MDSGVGEVGDVITWNVCLSEAWHRTSDILTQCSQQVHSRAENDLYGALQ